MSDEQNLRRKLENKARSATDCAEEGRAGEAAEAEQGTEWTLHRTLFSTVLLWIKRNILWKFGKFWTVANWFIESHVWTRGSHGTESCDEGGTLGDVGWGEEG